MCGIAGLIDFKKNISDRGLTQEAGIMNETLKHRGPDAGAVWTDPGSGVALAHRRLSILDLSPTGAQPMHSESGNYSIVFNGEIYNFRKLREELVSLGCIFRGTSDTEVLLCGIERWGAPETLKKIEGMFAFAVFCRRSQKVYLARDRLGEKPLIYCSTPDYFWFASEMRALEKSPLWSRFFGVINQDCLNYYFSFGNIPAPATIYRDVFKLMPGHFIEIDLQAGSQLRIEKYWDLQESVQAGKRAIHHSDGDATDRLETILTEVIQQQTDTDVPNGAFLSGGIDSSTVVALMQKNSREPIRTFSIGFVDADFNEAHHARAVADHLKTKHNELLLRGEAALEVIPDLAQIYDEPFGDSSQIPTYLVAKLAKTEVSVALSGDGGDELFAGYNRHVFAPRAWNVLKALPHPMRAFLGRKFMNLSDSNLERMIRLFSIFNQRLSRTPQVGEKFRKLASLARAASEEEMYYALQNGHENFNFQKTLNLEVVDDPVARQQFLDFLIYLPNDILVKVDRATMANSLESRMPFLSPRLVDFSWSLPLHQKIRNGTGKWLLREVLYRHVPKNLIDRPKAGFAIPVSLWLKGPLKTWADNLIKTSELKWVHEKWASHLIGNRDHSAVLWNFLMLQNWLRARGKSL